MVGLTIYLLWWAYGYPTTGSSLGRELKLEKSFTKLTEQSHS